MDSREILKNFNRNRVSGFDYYINDSLEKSRNGEKINVLVFGDVNLNLIDGSAIWVLSVANMLSTNKNIEVDVVLKSRIIKDRLVKQLLSIENVNVIDTFSIKGNIELQKESLSSQECVEFIEKYSKVKNYDFFIFRGINFVNSIVNNSDIMDKAWIYLTDFPHTKEELTPVKYDMLKKILSRCQRFLAQTEEMKEYICGIFPIDKDKISILNPMVPNINCNDIKIGNNRNRLVYSGKFAEMWNCIEFTKACSSLSEEIKLELNIVGDKFNKGSNENFEDELKNLFINSKCVKWYGGVSREKSIDIINSCDIGISWRSEELNNSLELSTKLLEYGINGKAVILNRTEMHEKLLGEDYPLYANSEEEFKEKVKLALNNKDIYETAAEKVFDLCKRYTFKNTYMRLEKDILEAYGYSQRIKTKREFDILDLEYLKNEYRRLLKIIDLEEVYDLLLNKNTNSNIEDQIISICKKIIDVYNIIPYKFMKGDNNERNINK